MYIVSRFRSDNCRCGEYDTMLYPSHLTLGLSTVACIRLVARLAASRSASDISNHRFDVSHSAFETMNIRFEQI